MGRRRGWEWGEVYGEGNGKTNDNDEAMMVVTRDVVVADDVIDR